jgi:hypothetical protein
MDNANFRLDIFVESLDNLDFDNDILPIPFKKIESNQGTILNKAEIFVEETTGSPQDLKIHVDVIQL